MKLYYRGYNKTTDIGYTLDAIHLLMPGEDEPREFVTGEGWGDYDVGVDGCWQGDIRIAGEDKLVDEVEFIQMIRAAEEVTLFVFPNSVDEELEEEALFSLAEQDEFTNCEFYITKTRWTDYGGRTTFDFKGSCNIELNVL